MTKRIDELKARFCEKCSHRNPCVVCLVYMHIKDEEAKGEWKE